MEKKPQWITGMRLIRRWAAKGWEFDQSMLLAMADDFDLIAFDETGCQVIGINLDSVSFLLASTGFYNFDLGSVEELERIYPDAIENRYIEKLVRKKILDPQDPRVCRWPGYRPDPTKARKWQQIRLERLLQTRANALEITQAQKKFLDKKEAEFRAAASLEKDKDHFKARSGSSETTDDPKVEKLIRQVMPEAEKIYGAIRDRVGFGGPNPAAMSTNWQKAALKRFDQNKKEFSLIKRDYLSEVSLYEFTSGQERRDFFSELIKVIVRDHGYSLSKREIQEIVRTIRKVD